MNTLIATFLWIQARTPHVAATPIPEPYSGGFGDAADYTTLVIGLAAFLVGCYFDFTASSEMGKYGIKEGNILVRGGDGKFSPLKGIIWIVAPIVLVLVAFFAFDETEYYDRFWAGFFLLPGAALHYWAGAKARKMIEQKKQNTVRPGGVL